jgi:hypothetical protein
MKGHTVTNIPVIGILGSIGSGKSTAAGFLRERLEYRGIACQSGSYADILKDAVAAIFQWPRHLLEGDTPESREFREQPDEWWSQKLGQTVTPRWALQHIGTNVFRNHFDINIWVYCLERRAANFSGVTIIPDVRFGNEINNVRSMGGLLLRVVRGPQPEWYPIAVDAVRGCELAVQRLAEIGVHPSDWGSAGFNVDYVINNSQTLRDLKESIYLIADQVANCNTD